MAKPWLDKLNDAQREAVTHGDGPLLVIAGAGTGKTNTLACRVAHLIDQGVQPGRILLLTFTRRAAREMLSRAGQHVGSSAAGQVWGGTFHSVAHRLLRIYGSALGLAPQFSVIDQSDAADVLNLIRSDLGLAKTDRRFPNKATLIRIYSRTVNSGRKLAEVLEESFPWCRDEFDGIREIFETYGRRKLEQNLVDYDDLLLYWSALSDTPKVGDAAAARFDHVLVDEYQDTNAIQAEILRGMRRTNANIMVVGDDAQAIYSFRAANVRNILDFPEIFPNTHRVTLAQNYRSIQPILDASNAVMVHAAERFTKDLWSNRLSERRPVLMHCVDETDQCNAVCTQILEHLEEGIPLMRQAVLFRAGHHSDLLEVELARRNIPFHKYGGLKFVESGHIKDLLAFMRILENPFDEISWFRVLQLLDGVGPRTARKVMDALYGANGRRDAVRRSPLACLIEETPAFPASVRIQMAAMRTALADCLGDGGSGPEIVAQIARIRRFYEPIFERKYDNAEIRIRDLEQLEHVAAGYRSRESFLADLTLDPPESTSDLAGPPHLDEDYLILSTIHSAKGCEWDAVHVIHAADGMIPSDMALGDSEGVEEERRLLYVAMTRAKDFLYVYFPLRYYHRKHSLGDAHSFAQLSRFLTPDVRLAFEERSRPPQSAEDPREVVHPAGAQAVHARLRELWT